jgi:hypothetical protein
MKRISLVGLCLAAVFAFGATSAFAAAPTYKVCVKAAKSGKTYTGKYNDKNCTEANAKSEGKYELASWASAKKKGFKTKSGKSTLYSYIPSVGIAGTVVCAKDKGEGEITGESTSKSTVIFEKCESSGFKCTSTGESKAGDIKTNPLLGTLVNLEGGKVGQVVEAVGGGASAEFSCEGHLHVITVGSLVGEETGNNGVISKEATLAFHVNSKTGEQEPGEAEGTPHTLYSEIESEAFTGTLPSGEETEDAIKGEAEGIYG